MLVNFARRAELNDLAGAHDGDPVAHGERLVLIVGHVDDRRGDRAVQCHQLQFHHFTQAAVERAEWLVHEQHRRLVDEGAGEGDALLLATAELDGFFGA